MHFIHHFDNMLQNDFAHCPFSRLACTVQLCLLSYFHSIKIRVPTFACSRMLYCLFEGTVQARPFYIISFLCPSNNCLLYNVEVSRCSFYDYLRRKTFIWFGKFGKLFFWFDKSLQYLGEF